MDYTIALHAPCMALACLSYMIQEKEMAFITVPGTLAVLGIVGGVITIVDWGYEQVDEEKKFEKLIRAMERASREHPRVAKFNGWYIFGHRRDFERIEVKGGKLSYYPRKNAVNLRNAYFKPVDGWKSNNWLYGTGKTVAGKYYRTEPVPMSTDDCLEIFKTKHTDSDGSYAAYPHETTIRVT